MEINWFPFALIALLLWVVGNILDKYLVTEVFKKTDDEEDIETLILFSLFASIPLLIILISFWNTELSFSMRSSVGMVSGIFSGFFLWFYLKSVARSELSRVIPFFQLVPVFGLISAWLFLSEFPNLVQIISGALIIIGALTLTYHHNQKKIDTITAIFMILASLSLALQAVVFKYVTTDSNYTNALFWTNIGLLIFCSVLLLILPNTFLRFIKTLKQSGTRAVGWNLLNEIVDSSANLTFLFAISLGPVAVVQTITSFQPGLILIVGIISTKLKIKFLNEDFSSVTFWQKAVGILLTLVGGCLLFLNS